MPNPKESPCQACPQPHPCDNQYMDGECPNGRPPINQLPIDRKIALMTALSQGNTPAQKED